MGERTLTQEVESPIGGQQLHPPKEDSPSGKKRGVKQTSPGVVSLGEGKQLRKVISG